MNELQGSDFQNLISKSSHTKLRRELLKRIISERQGSSSNQELAIIGLSGRYPMSSTLDGLWNNLQNGTSCISEIPSDRWDFTQYYEPGFPKEGKSYSKWGGFIEDIDKFDPLFFNISPREAELMDPQERLFLETAWALFEDAGLTRKSLAHFNYKVGVFAGVMNGNYVKLGGNPVSYWSIANRVSYYFNLQGPSLAVDTACSSSLTAIHLACESIQRGECEVAIAGGVNLIVHPEHFNVLASVNMLSKDEKCKAFGDGADGFVDGEGVGAVLLKRLDKAIEDGDHIYGVIKGSSMNAGGKTSGFTVPNPNAQAELISQVLRKAKIDPKTISYVEAHGTGTSLGDPIEIAGLSKAFQDYTQEKQYCAIGSVKSNIGHLESAAGIAGLTKVLLQFQHKQLVPSLHANVLNPHIDFENSPFYVQQKVQEWKQPVIIEEGEERTCPRRASISSFGAGGANAHLIVEEYEPSLATPAENEGLPQVIVLSAKNEERLQIYAEKLINYLETKEASLEDIAYTLQVGREALEERIALVVSTREELKEKLRQYCQGIIGIQDFYQGNIKKERSNSTLVQGEEGREFISQLVSNRKISKLGELWVMGVKVDWPLLFSEARPKRISLPTYPFAREQYWVSTPLKIAQGIKNINKLHPLISINVSTLHEQKFETSLIKKEFYLADHKINGEIILPGAASIEMARAAGEIAGEQKIVRLQDINWLRPITLEDDSCKVETRLYPDGKAVRYEISTHIEEKKIINAKGKLLYESSESYLQSQDINMIKNRCLNVMDGSECYSLFQQAGFTYGSTFQSIQKIYSNSQEALSYLELPSQCIENFDEFVLHPSLMDGAFQTLLGLVNSSGSDSAELYVPFSIKEIEIKDSLKEKCYVYVTLIENKKNSKTFNLQVIDEEGKVLVVIKQLSLRALQIHTNNSSMKEITKEIHSSKNKKLDSEGILTKGKSKLKEQTEFYLKTLLSKKIKLLVEKIDEREPLESYGIDSVMIMNLSKELENDFGELSKTLFFEYQNISELAQYFIKNHYTQLIKVTKWDKSSYEKHDLLTNTNDDPPTHKRFFDDVNPSPDINGGQEDLAIIGLSGRFPMADNLDEFWMNLKHKKNCVTTIPKERWDYQDYVINNVKNKKDKTNTKWGGFIEDVDKFDPLFFNISPREAEIMDPQERLFLETVWHTLEDAGYPKSKLSRDKVGVFVGVMYGHYQLYGAEESLKGNVIALSSSHASIANRVSYFFNFKGPSIAIDTMCSSSLTSIHLACESLRRGECDTAIAGGVNLSLHPNKYVSLSQGNFISDDGKCRAFGEGGEGYVPGEGIGAILLKPLDKAIKDKDRIYGVVKASALNHGGKTNGYTVPNPNAQAGLIKETLEKAKIDPRTISYIEAHGTGTSLGDPIEITGLNKAFQDYTQEKQYCAIGSVKSNIGHLESAAGIAGLTKVLLQFQHKQLVPSLHANVLNPHIDFENSPFYVQQEVQEWKQPVIIEEGKEQTCPRRASISSFGAGGANAHLIVEEYEPSYLATPVEEQDSPHLIILSAKNEERLQVYAEKLINYLEKKEASLADIAYTLQVGREALEERIALVVSTREELKEKLRQYCQGIIHAEGFYHGNVKKNRSDHIIVEEKDGEGFLDKLISARKSDELAELWVKGLEIEWSLLYLRENVKRISLPNYPFFKKRYWVPKSSGKDIQSIKDISKLHPLLDVNTSTLQGQKFETSLIKKEFYLADHKINGEIILPGAASIEMARAAGEIAGEQKIVRLQDINWLRPITLEDDSCKVETRLYPDGKAVRYEISTHIEEKKIINAKGKLLYESSESYLQSQDINMIKNRCLNVMDGSECYSLFQQAGFTYGSTFQSIQKIYSNSQEALSYLELPSQCIENFDEFVLHPSLMDGAFQTLLGLVNSSGSDSTELYVPFSIKEIEIKGSLKEKCYVYVTLIENKKNSKTFNLQVMDEEGKVLVVIKQLSLRTLQVPKDPLLSNKIHCFSDWEEAPLGVSMLAKEWQGSLLLLDTQKHMQDLLIEQLPRGVNVILVKIGESFRFLGDNTYEMNPAREEDYSHLVESLRDRGMAPEYILHRWFKEHGIVDDDQLSLQLERGIYSLLHLTKALMKLKAKHKIRLLYTYENWGEIKPLDAAVAGFAKTIRLEHPKLVYKTLEIQKDSENTVSTAKSVSLMIKELMSELDHEYEVCYKNGIRFTKQLKEIINDNKNTSMVPFRKKGVYLITGGVGGLGFIFAEFLAKQAQARLVLTGRSALSLDKQGKIKELEQLGAEVTYIQADISSQEAVGELIRKIKSRFSEIHGVIHSAGILRDGFVFNKKLEEMQEVLAPKVHGTVWLDKATQKEPLDFFVLFSSIAAISGNIGQSDYAYGNSFMDYYATWRSEQEHPGKTLSINWPLWKEGGMTVGEEKASFLKVLGMEPMSTENGINTFVAGLKQSAPQLIVAQGDVKKIKDIWGITKQQVKEETVPVSISVEKDNNKMIFQKVQEKVIQGVSAILKIDKNEIDLHSEMNEFGFDSVTLTEYSNLLNEQYNLNIMPSIFFEHSTLYAFTEYLWEEYNQELKDYYLDEIVASDKKATMQVKEVPMVQKEEIPSLETPLSDNKPARNERSEQISDPIAIVGISGMMPQSPDLTSFWKNLEDEKDLITEIPDDRWDWKAYYGDSTKESNKTPVKWGGFIPDVDKFDALFFGISPREAAMMDPQQRILMETVWKTIENAGYKTSDLSGTSTGIFIGIGRLDYIDILKEQGFEVDLEIGTGNSHIMMVNRISYLLNLRGPSEPVDTACSSSLVAIHRAVESIRNGDCDMAIAGGINLILSPSAQNTINNWGLLCEDGRCKTFDKRANGYVRGEGCGVLLLKPLSKAEADGDHIYGVIKGTAINHGGRANSLSAPNPTAQAELLVSAWKKAQVDPTTVTYIEAHGTGTSLGDPIEINGMKKAFEQLYKDWGKTMPSQAHCGIGAVKSNIGHLESASGIAGILKVLLAMKHQRLPRNLHLEEMNPYIQLEGSPFYLLSNSKEWERLKDEQSREIPRRAGVSAFGFGGVNAHIVLEEYERPVETATPQHREQIIVLSAKNKDRLKAYASNMVNYLETTTSSLEEIAYTLQVGREAMEERLALIVSSIEELRKGLNYYIQGNTDEGKLFISNSKASDKNIIKPLLKGRAGKEFIRIIVEDQQIAELGRLWVAGVDIEWELLYQFYKPNRLPLSTYPFEKTSYWYKDFKDIVLLSSNEVDNDRFIELETRGSGIELNNIDLEKNKEVKILEENNYSALSSIENKLMKIWSTMLDLKEVDINQTFFDLGGDSISIIKLFEEVDRQFPGKINITDFFSHPTVAQLAQHICSENNVMNTSIKQIEEGIKGYQLKNN